MSPRCLLAVLALVVGGRRRRGRGGGAFSLSALLRKHVRSTAQARGTALVPPLGGGGVAVWLPLSPYPFCGCTPGGPPVGACTARAPLGHGRVDRSALSSLRLPTLPRCPRGGVRRPLPSSLMPPRLLPVTLACSLGGCGRWGRGGGGRPRCPSSGVSTSQARHWHVARHLSFCWGVGHAAWPPSSPCPLCVRSPGAPPAGARSALATLGRGRAVCPAPSPRCPPIVPLCPREGGPLSAPPFLYPPPLGGRRHVGGGGGGGGGLSFSLRCSRVAGTRRGSRPSAGGGGGFCLAAPFAAPSILRPHPRWSPRRGLHGARPLRARSCGSSRTLLPLPPHPAALPSGGGEGAFRPLPARVPRPRGGGGVGGGRGALFASPPLHARRRHDVGTTQRRGEALGCCGGGGGVSLWAFPPCSVVQAPYSRITSRCCPLGGSRHVSAWCSVSRACSLLCPYLLEEVRTRVESEDEEVRVAGRTYRTPRRLLAPSAALVEGRAPVSAPNSPGGGDRPSSPWCLCIHFRAA